MAFRKTQGEKTQRASVHVLHAGGSGSNTSPHGPLNTSRSDSETQRG